MRRGRGAGPLDRGRQILRAVAAVLVLLLGACAEPAPAPDLPLNRDTLRALRWIAPGADKVRALTTEPVSCRNSAEQGNRVIDLDDPAGGATTTDIGELAFESPALLGGAAGRMGLSCASCHLNGRNNPDFFIEGVSAAPGTADVTNSLFSKTRGNGAFDPVSIPDISTRDGKQIRDRRSPEFAIKVHGLIVEEFDGLEPGEQIFDAVIAYMDGLVPCPDPALRQRLSAQRDIVAANRSFLIAGDMKTPGEQRLMARAARERLERLNERFIAANQQDVRAALLDASRAIQRWMDAPDAKLAAEAVDALRTAKERVIREASRSLYNPDVLRAALAR